MTTPQLSMALGAAAGVVVDREHAHEHEPGWLGVTTVLRLTGFSDFSHVPPDRLEFGRQRGLAVHLVTELEDAGDQDGVRRCLAEAPAGVDLAGFLSAYLSFRSETGWALCGSEVFVRSQKLMVRGRVDRVFWTGSTLAVIDLKPRVLDAAALDCAKLQTAGYALAVAEEMDLGIGKSTQAFGPAQSFARYALCLAEDGRYKLLPQFTDAVDFVEFGCAARCAHRIARRGR